MEKRYLKPEGLSIFIFLFFSWIFNIGLNAQTMGVVQSHSGSLEGYTFFSPFSGTKAWMVDNCGQLINVWDRGTRPGLAAYFLENGLMFRTYKAPLNGPFTSASNAGGIELVDWNNNTIWSYEINTEAQLSHHDAVYLPNGNVLVLTWDLVFAGELIALGRDPNEIAFEGFMWSERIQELQPVGTNSANIVWEWQIKDHYVQDFDPTKEGYGVVSEHPELFDINLPDLNSNNSNATRDWNHFNAIDYHPELDQILISTRNSDEIWILDHSTTTAQAAGHTGGLYGKGGDILYRWGNAAAYGRASTNDQKLFGQHGVNWIKNDLTDSGKILIFNNGNGRPGTDFSTVDLLTPPKDINGGYILPETEPFEPEFPEIVYGDGAGEFFYSSFLSNAQRLSNGNTLINAGSPGEVFEIDQNKNIVWKYVIPLFGDTPGTQGGNISNNSSFRAYKYPADFPGFEGLDLTPGSTIEIGENPLGCILSSANHVIPADNTVQFKFNTSAKMLEVYNPKGLSFDLILFDINGRQLLKTISRLTTNQISVQHLNAGIYFINVALENEKLVTSKFLIF